MRGFSKAIITGNLTRDPEVRTTASGSNVCTFAVAVNRTYRDANGDTREDVSFIDCSAWGRLGETINQYAKKGSSVLVSGRLDQHSWDDKTTGQKRSRVEIVVENFNFLGSPNRDGGNNYSSSYNSTPTPAAAPAGDIPPIDEPVPDDIPEGEIDLSEVPF